MKIFRSIHAGIYKYIAKPILFLYSPDAVHTFIVRLAKVVQKVPLFVKLGRVFYSHQNNEVLGQVINGVNFKNPIGISAGFDKNVQLRPTLEMIGCGFMTGGSITKDARSGNDRPWFHRLKKTRSIVVHAGLANHGLDAIAKNVQSKSNQADIPLIISVAAIGSKQSDSRDDVIEQVCQTVVDIEKHNLAQSIEVNISCPNVCDDEYFIKITNLTHLLAALDELNLSIPVYIKMPNKPWSDFEPIVDEVARHSIDGVTIANLMKDRNVVDLKDELSHEIKGGLSGVPCFNQSNELIHKTYQKYGKKLTIIGVGGVFSADDAYEKIRSGASLVGLITGMIFEGPQLIGDINEGLVKRVKSDGFNSVTEAIGASVARVE